MSWVWQDEPAPPEPQGMVGVGAAAQRLLAALERVLQPSALMLTANDNVLVLTGPSHTLPWIDGAHYIAPRPQAPALWLPTTQRPSIPLDLLERVIQRKHMQQPVLLLPHPACLVPLTRLLPLDANMLLQIRKRWQHNALP